MSKHKKIIVYVINSLDPGGAEIGLELLINNGLFENVSFHLVAINRCNSDLEQRIASKLSNDIIYLSDETISNKRLLIYAFQLTKIINKLKPDVVISALTQSVIISRIARLTCKFKHITFEHNTEFQNKIAFYLTKYSDFLTDDFWCDSEATQRSLLARHSDAANLIVPLFHAQAGIEAKTNFAQAKNFRIMSVGRLMAQKNYLGAIKTIKQLQAEGINATLDIFGGGELQSELEAAAIREGVREAIHFRGFVQGWQLEAHSYDAYLLCSDFEGLSIATLEAMGAGLPCVVRPVGELQNYISHNKTGMFARDVDEAAKCLAEIYYKPAFAASLGNNASKYVCQIHSEKKFQKQLQQARMGIGISI